VYIPEDAGSRSDPRTEKKSESLSAPDAQEEPAELSWLTMYETATASGCKLDRAATSPPEGGAAVAVGPGWNVTETPPALKLVVALAEGTENV
jgi:hypothetical protein